MRVVGWALSALQGTERKEYTCGSAQQEFVQRWSVWAWREWMSFEQCCGCAKKKWALSCVQAKQCTKQSDETNKQFQLKQWSPLNIYLARPLEWLCGEIHVQQGQNTIEWLTSPKAMPAPTMVYNFESGSVLRKCTQRVCTQLMCTWTCGENFGLLVAWLEGSCARRTTTAP
jgi:hypothetical protein